MNDYMYRRIKGIEIFNFDGEEKELIVDGLICKGDHIMLVAEEKVGKTILIQQLSASLTSGVPFLGLPIPKPRKVMYFITEGRASDIKDRFFRINNHTKINLDNLELIPSFFKFNTKEGIECLNEIIENTPVEEYPEVVVIDSLYSGFSGSLKEDRDVNAFNHTVRLIIDKLNCAVIVVHHMTKNSRDKNGNYHQRSDKDCFGSTFLSAAVDHTLWLEKWKDKNFPKDRILRCDTQRSGSIVAQMRMRMEEPDPLFFYEVNIYAEEAMKIQKLLDSSEEPLTREQIQSKLKFDENLFRRSIKSLIENKIVFEQKDGIGKPQYQKKIYLTNNTKIIPK